MEAQLDPIFENAIKSGRVPGAAAVVLDVKGNTLFSKGYGNVTFGDDKSPKVEPDTPALIWSCTKLVTSVAMLQLIENNKAELMDEAEKYYPGIRDIKVLKGWNEDGTPDLADPESHIKLLHLFTHTSGMNYDLFNADALHWRSFKGQEPVQYVTKSSKEEYTNPLVFEPGTRHEYGCNIDYLGLCIERISGLRLNEYIDKNIIQPLGLKNTGVGLNDAQSKVFFTVHTKDAEGKLTPTPLRMVENPEVMPGGHYLYSSTSDYANFLLTLLNNGTHPVSGVQILKPETVKDYLFTDMLPTVGCSGDGVGDIPCVIPQVSCAGSFLPGVPKGWSCGGLINKADVPNGRHKGSLAWAGLGNCYYWVDPTEGKLGFVVSAILPFFDRDVLVLADALERAVYGKPMPKEIGERGSNFEGGFFRADEAVGA